MSFATSKIQAEVRENKGTGVARALRREGKVPAVVYSKGKTQMLLAVDARELMLDYQRGRFFSRIIEVDAGGKKVNVLPQELQLDPVKDKPLHVDFIGVEAKSRVKVSVPMEFINHEKSPGLKKGGILNMVRRAIDVFCDADSIPEKFVADLDNLNIGGNIKWHNINAAKGVEPVIRGRDFTIATIAGRMAEEEVSTAPGAATADAAAAAPAAGAAAPAAAPAAKK